MRQLSRNNSCQHNSFVVVVVVVVVVLQKQFTSKRQQRKKKLLRANFWLLVVPPPLPLTTNYEMQVTVQKTVIIIPDIFLFSCSVQTCDNVYWYVSIGITVAYIYIALKLFDEQDRISLNPKQKISTSYSRAKVRMIKYMTNSSPFMFSTCYMVYTTHFF